MKSVLLYANDDSGMPSRLEAGLDVARAFDSHITFLQVTPYNAFIMGDPFGGAYALPEVMAEIRAAETTHRSRIESDLSNEGATWDWLNYDGQPAQVVLDRSRLADLVVLSMQPRDGRGDGPLSLTGDVAIHARAPVLAVPHECRKCDVFGPALVAWNGSMEGSHAIRLALPMLQKAKAVHIVTVSDDETGFPAVDACKYLARHGVTAELHEWPRDGRRVADAILDAAARLDASYIVMGAYGHSRIREAVLGGVTRDLLADSNLPLLLAH